MVQHYIASCVGWVSRLTSLDLQTNQTYKCALGRELVCMQENYYSPAQASARSPQSCPTLCDPMGHNMPAVCPWDSPARILEWREQDGGGVGGHGAISLQGYARNTPSDTKVHEQHQLRVD